LRRETATGTGWRRYTHDGYGEAAGGAPYTGSGGAGRCWPLLALERAHYELAAGNRAEAERLLKVVAGQASDAGMLSEQIWDADDIPECELFNGRPTGSAMPLVWAHAEALKLIRSLHDGQVFDTPPQTVARYLDPDNPAPVSPFTPWRLDLRTAILPEGKRLRIEIPDASIVQWRVDDELVAKTTETRDTGLGIHVADLPTEALTEGQIVRFTVVGSDAIRTIPQDKSDGLLETIEFTIKVVSD